MKSIRTPESRFENLKDYSFEPHYTEVDAGDGSALRMHYVDEGEGEIILCLHGQPSWSYLYRKMIPLLTKAGYRVIALTWWVLVSPISPLTAQTIPTRTMFFG